MLDDKKRAELEQGRAELREVLPVLWKEMYTGLKENFNDQQSWELLKVVVFAQSGGKASPV